MWLNCPCGAKPSRPEHKHSRAACLCGNVYDAQGYLRATDATPEDARQIEHENALQESPENARCSKCGNAERFIGHDDDGYGGPTECEGGEDAEGTSCPNGGGTEGFCGCITHLAQPFRVERDDTGKVIEVHYAEFTGGSFDAEISDYNRIDCAECGHEVYREQEAAHAPT